MTQNDGLTNTISQIGEKVANFGANVIDEVERDLGEITSDLEKSIKNWIDGIEYNPRPILDAIREVKPCLVVGDYALITRFDDCTTALGNDAVFPVPFGPKMKAITEDENFILGMQPTDRYIYDKSVLWLAFRRDDADTLVRPIVEQHASEIVRQAGGELDVVPNLFRQIPIEIVRHYFGVPIAADRAAGFASDTQTVDTYVFGDLESDPAVATAAKVAAARLSEDIQAGIDAVEANPPASYEACQTVIERLIVLRRAGLTALPDKHLRPMVMGFFLGFVPNNTIAASNALDQLLDRPEALASAQQAARNADHESLLTHWFEALRFNPINPGAFRNITQPFTVPGGGVGGLSDVTIPAGKTVLVATQAAMFDSNRIDDPASFRLDRPKWNYLFYGHGTHFCMGNALTNMQIPTTWAYLLRQNGLRRASGEAGQLRADGAFPTHMTVTWES